MRKKVFGTFSALASSSHQKKGIGLSEDRIRKGEEQKSVRAAERKDSCAREVNERECHLNPECRNSWI